MVIRDCTDSFNYNATQHFTWYRIGSPFFRILTTIPFCQSKGVFAANLKLPFQGNLSQNIGQKEFTKILIAESKTEAYLGLAQPFKP